MNNSIKKCLKYVVNKILPKIRTYCLACRKHTNNINPKHASMTNKVVRNKSRCSECLSDM